MFETFAELPQFDGRGQMPPGVHRCNPDQFLRRFAEGPGRSSFFDPIRDIIGYATNKQAKSILVGGSFITKKSNPNDLDCVILFGSEKQIPIVRDGLTIDANRIDIFFASQDNPEIVKSFLKLFSTSRVNSPSGVVEIVLYDNEEGHWDQNWEPDINTYEIVSRMYLGRAATNTVRRDKILVTVHGIRSYGEWDADVTLIASANGWVVAPFRYGYVQPDVFFRESYRQELKDRFRKFLWDVRTMTEASSVSVIAHSFGTYLSMSYQFGLDRAPVRFDTLILLGSIINRELEFSKLNGKIGHIINEVAPNDEWADWAAKANFRTDPLFGESGTKGFNFSGDRLTEYRSDIFKHNNVIGRDLLVSRWLPAMEANFGSAQRDYENFHSGAKSGFPKF